MGRILVGVLLLASQSACAGELAVGVSGGVDAGVIFSLEATRSDRLLDGAHVIEVIVLQESGEEVWPTIWLLEGDARIEIIRYGDPPPGLEELIRPTVLAPGGRYRVIVSALELAQRTAVSDFAIDANGRVVILPFDPLK